MSRRRARRYGRWAEALCVVSLMLRGWRIEARHFLVGRGSGAGEIDIVARRGRVLAVIEVKGRSDLARAAAAIQPRQRRRLARSAAALLQRRPDLAALDLRFDAMLVRPWRLPCHVEDAWRERG